MAEIKKSSVKSKVEAVLFSTGHRISLDEIGKLCRARKEDVLAALQELKKEYEDKQSSLMLAEEGDFWKFTVRDHFIPMIRKIVTETELTKSVLETLAVIAFKYPILQSDLIKIRTNKAYDHLAELEKSGYISRQKHSRTNLIKLTEKFFRYFDLTEENLKEKFRDFDSIAKAIKEKEIEVDKIREDQHAKAEDLRKEDEKIKKEIESLDESEDEFEVPLETYKSTPKDIVSEEFEQEGNLVVEKEKIGDLEVIEDAQNQKAPHHEKGRHAAETADGAKKEENGKADIHSKEEINSGKYPKNEPCRQKKKSGGIKVTPEMEAIIDKKVEMIVHPDKENKEEKKEI